MSIADARQFAEDAELAADVCIIGAGAAGIVLATELASVSSDVCLLESGGLMPEEDTQNLYDLTSVGYPIRERFMARARYYGGSCNLWAGRSMELNPADLAPHEGMPGGGWPIGYEELTAHYARAAEILRLPRIAQFQPQAYAERLSLQERRLFSLDPLMPTVSLWARKPMRFGAAYKRRLAKSDRIQLVLHANVTKIRLTPDGSAVQGVNAATLDGRRLTVRARLYVLACGGLENARLLLISRDVQNVGIGNQFDIVGRYFMDHPRSVFGRVRLGPGCRLPLLEGYALPDGKVQFGIGLSPEARRREGLLNHYVTLEAEFSAYTAAGYHSMVRTMKILLRRGHAGSRWKLGRAQLADIPGMIYLLTPKELMPHPVYRAYRGLRGMLSRGSHGNRVLVYFCEQPPHPASRVTLDAERDRLGLPKLRLEWRIGPEVTASILRMQTMLQERLRAAAIGELEAADREPTFTDASHHMGTTRMSVSPRSGVVDRDCRVHSVQNLFIAGSSVFPMAGHANPTLTIVALALRLVDRLRKELT